MAVGSRRVTITVGVGECVGEGSGSTFVVAGTVATAVKVGDGVNVGAAVGTVKVGDGINVGDAVGTGVVAWVEQAATKNATVELENAMKPARSAIVVTPASNRRTCNPLLAQFVAVSTAT